MLFSIVAVAVVAALAAADVAIAMSGTVVTELALANIKTLVISPDNKCCCMNDWECHIGICLESIARSISFSMCTNAVSVECPS